MSIFEIAEVKSFVIKQFEYFLCDNNVHKNESLNFVLLKIDKDIYFLQIMFDSRIIILTHKVFNKNFFERSNLETCLSKILVTDLKKFLKNNVHFF